MEPIVVITVRGGMVTFVTATVPATVIVEDWDCPPNRPLIIDFESELLTPNQLRRAKAKLGALNNELTNERKRP